MALQTGSDSFSRIAGCAQAHDGSSLASGRVELTVVLPLYNDELTLPRVYRRLKAVLRSLGFDHELLLVDDGSVDGTAACIRELSKTDPAVTALVLARHTGKEMALRAGLERAGGRAIIIASGDPNHPPELIPRMVEAWRAGADVVRMCPEQCDFMLCSRRAASAFSLLVDRKRYMKRMIQWAGLREVIVEYETEKPNPARPGLGGGSQFSRFLISGGAATLVHWLVMAILVSGGLNSVVATTVGAVAGSILNYVFQSSWTFGGIGRHAAAVPAYVCVVMSGWVANAVLYGFLTRFAEWGLAPAQICTTALVTVMNFVLYKRIVFHERVTRNLAQ